MVRTSMVLIVTLATLGLAAGALAGERDRIGRQGKSYSESTKSPTLSVSSTECKHECHDRAERVFHACIHETDLSEEECGIRARRAFEACVTEHCDELPDCVLACREDAEMFYHDCIAGGGSHERCAEQTHAFVEECVATRCGEPPIG